MTWANLDRDFGLPQANSSVSFCLSSYVPRMERISHPMLLPPPVVGVTRLSHWMTITLSPTMTTFPFSSLNVMHRSGYCCGNSLTRSTAAPVDKPSLRRRTSSGVQPATARWLPRPFRPHRIGTTGADGKTRTSGNPRLSHERKPSPPPSAHRNTGI